MANQTIKNLLVSTLTNRWISSLATGILGHGIPIFMLHRIYPDNTPGKIHTPSYLRKCLTYLKKHNYHFVSVTEILQSIIHNTCLPKKSVAFTIDDGFIDQALLAAPVFIEFKCPVSIFLITDFLDGKMWPWFSKVRFMMETTNAQTIEFETKSERISLPLKNMGQKYIAYRRLSDLIKHLDWSFHDTTLSTLADLTDVDISQSPPEQYRPMTWDLARELESKGIMFGPHTLTHPILSKVSDEQSRNEIIHSWRRVKEELNAPAPVFCYPNGSHTDYGSREIEILKNTDMIGALSTIPMQFRPNSVQADIAYNLPRYSLPENYNDFIMYCSWIEYTIERLRKN